MRRHAALVLVVLGLVAGGCGDDGAKAGEKSGAQETATPEKKKESGPYGY